MPLVPLVRFSLLAVALRASARAFDSSSAAGLELVPFDDRCRLGVGMTRAQIIDGLKGEPDDKLTRDIWVYWDVHAKNRPEGARYTAAIIVFAGDRASRIRLADSESTRALLAKLRMQQSPPPVVAAQ